jgi:hypothetical protein
MTQELSERQKALYESEWANFVQRHKDGGDPWISADAAIFIDSKLASPSASPSSAADGGVETDAQKLGAAIAGVAQRLGIYNGEVGLTGPDLLQLLADIESCAARPAAAPAQDAEMRNREIARLLLDNEQEGALKWAKGILCNLDEAGVLTAGVATPPAAQDAALPCNLALPERIESWTCPTSSRGTHGSWGSA